MDWQTVKRFYREAAAKPSRDGYTVALDGRPIRTPAGAAFELPSLPLAEALAGEWEAQEEQIKPHTMPLTQLAATGLDRISVQREAIIAEMLRYAGTDLLCYWATDQAELAARQQLMWEPLLQWAAEEHGARLSVTTGILPLAQPGEAIDALRDAIEDANDLELAALSSVAAATGSLVVALALAEGEIDAETAFEVSQVEETFQIEQWGEDEEAVDRRARLKADIAAADRFLELLSE